MRIDELMATSGVQFGTSGARGLVSAMTDRVCYGYTLGFVQHAQSSGQYPPGGAVAFAGDYRASTPRILAACAHAIRASGGEPRYVGTIPTPALAAHCLAEQIPGVMVTGSHIPDDRNGLKFYLPSGEILKPDEQAMRAQSVALPAALFTPAGDFVTAPALPPIDPAAFADYVRRYTDFFPADCLAGLRLGVYEHSSVAREALVAVLTQLGATVTRLGYSAQFMPVDTEAIRADDIRLAQDWCASGAFDALVSADGDGDRPLLSDEHGHWWRGDIAGIVCARALGATAVVTPISSNTAVERCGWFHTVTRTRIGSPYVIAAMHELLALGHTRVVGYEANGGFLQATPLERDGRQLPALPTRDAVIVAVAVLDYARAQRQSLSALAATLPQRFTASDRLPHCPPATSRAYLAQFNSGDPQQDCARVDAALRALVGGAATAVDHTDGVRITFDTGDIVHLRQSGNAPELRVYAEAATPERAQQLPAQLINDALRPLL